MLKKGFFLSLLFLLLWTATRHSLIQTMPLFDGDGHIHYKQLIDMWSGVLTLNPFKLFSFNLNYGTPYFFLALLFSIPGQILHNDFLFLMGPRLIAIFSALGTVYLTFKILQFYLEEKTSLWVASLLCLMPSFWIISRIFRPDWALTFCTSTVVYFLVKDQHHFGRSFWKAIFCFGLAIATKTQAVMFMPIIMAYCGLNLLFKRPTLEALKTSSLVFLKSCGLLFLVFFTINPHTLHPVGFYGVIRRFVLELVQLVPNPAETLTLWERLDLLSSYTFSIPILITALTCSIISCYTLFRKKESPELFAVILGSLPSYIFMFFLCQKFNWNFLLSAIPFLPLYCIVIFKTISKRLSTTLLIGCTLISFVNIYPWKSFIFYPKFEEINIIYTENTSFIIPLLKPYEEKLHYIGVSNSSIFDYKQLNLTFQQVRVMLNLLDTWHINPDAHEQHWRGLRKMQKKFNLTRFSIKPYYPRQAIILSKDHPASNPDLIKNLRENKTDYYLLGENRYVYVFIHKKLL